MQTLNDYKIPLENLIGQSNDGADNMRGQLKGLKTMIQNDAPQSRIYLVQQSRFNLVVNAVCSSSLELKRAIGMLEEQHVFMTGYQQGNGPLSPGAAIPSRFPSSRTLIYLR